MDRTGYIGGSDWYELLDGCELRLWKTKRGEDGGREVTGAMQRGTKMEPLVKEEYVERTGRKIRNHNTLIRHKSFPWAAAHIDAWTYDDTSRGVLECKTAAPHMFRTFKRDGLPQHYIAQMNWYLYVTGSQWGEWAVLEPVDWEFETFRVLRDDVLIQALHERAMLAWAKIENGPAPEKLDAFAKPCRKCAWRAECHPVMEIPQDIGDAEQDDSIEEIAAALANARKIKADADRYEKECAETLTETLGSRLHVVSGELEVIRQTSPRAGYTVAPTNVTTLRVRPRK